MPTVLLIRHGETDFVKKGRLAGRLPGVPLNEHGQKQAQVVAEKLAGAPIKAIYSSPIERAMQTAEPIAKALNLEIIQRQGLIETEIGEWQDVRVKDVNRSKSWKIIQSSPSLFRFPGGESFAETQFRISSEIQALSAQHDPKDTIICVSHADPIKLAIAYFIGIPFDLFQRIEISTASISILHMSESSIRLAAMNLHADLSLTFPKT
jgi:probable phosphomutase (TIGR03848 family)